MSPNLDRCLDVARCHLILILYTDAILAAVESWSPGALCVGLMRPWFKSPGMSVTGILKANDVIQEVEGTDAG